MFIRQLWPLVSALAVFFSGCEEHGQDPEEPSSSASLEEISSPAFSSSSSEPLSLSSAAPLFSSAAPLFSSAAPLFSSSSLSSSSLSAYNPVSSSSSALFFPDAVAGAIWDKDNDLSLASPFATQGYWMTYSSMEAGEDSSYVFPNEGQYEQAVELTGNLALTFSFAAKAASSWASFGFAWKSTSDLSAQGGLCLTYHTLETIWTLKVEDSEGRSLSYTLPPTPFVTDPKKPALVRIAFQDMKPSTSEANWQDIANASTRISFNAASASGDMMLMRLDWYMGCKN